MSYFVPEQYVLYAINMKMTASNSLISMTYKHNKNETCKTKVQSFDLNYDLKNTFMTALMMNDKRSESMAFIFE